MSKIPDSNRRSKAVRLLDGERAFVGIDVHKKTYAVCVWTEGREAVATWVQPADPAVLMRRLQASASQIAGVVQEAGPTGYALVRALRASGFRADVVAPSKTPNSPGRRAKGDRRDAAELAFLASKDMLTPIYVPTPQQEADRQVVRRRSQLARDFRRTKHRIKSFLLQHGLPAFGHWSRRALAALRTVCLSPELRWSLDSLLADYDHLKTQLGAADRQVAELARGPRHRRAVALLQSVPGVGILTAMAFHTELPQPERFATPEAVGSFTGLAPCVRQSGETTRGGGILRTGNPALRTLLVEAAWRWKRYEPLAQDLYHHLLSHTATPNKAIVGVARHLAILLWTVLTHDAPYTPAPRPPKELQ